MRVLGPLLVLVAMAVTARAQNSDLGVVLILPFKGANPSFQVNYARQILQRRAGRLYIEVPFSMVRPSGYFHLFSFGSESKYLLTPGLRYHVHLNDRAALYVAAGGGFGLSYVPYTMRKGWAFDIGGGLDYRLTHLWSVRGDVRNLRWGKSLNALPNSFPADFPPGNTALTVLSLGFGLHF